MALLRLNKVSISFGDNPVLQEVDLAIDEHQRSAVVGRNGTGKSTLLKIIAGSIKPDDGERTLTQGLKLAYLRQDVPNDLSGTIYDVVASGLPDIGELLASYHNESLLLEQSGDVEAQNTGKLHQLQSEIDACDGWQLQHKVAETLSRMQLEAGERFEQLSGGMKRRVLLARALLTDPDILLLDEPTNHLDIASIQWLEQYLQTLRCSLVFITHDRSFLQKLANRIIDLDRGQLTDWPGNYQKFLTGKQQLLETESQQNAAFDKKLAQEEVWIRQGIKARRTRNEGRVRALKKLRDERRKRIDVSGTVNLQANTASRSGKKVIEATDIKFSFDGESDTHPIVNGFNTTIMRGDKIGVIGPNGVGKSTLIKLLLGELEPQSGKVEHGTNLEVAYFDQLRDSLNLSATAMDNVSGGRDMVTINNEERHIISYMQDFLFSPQRARAPITALSGGETNRLMLAKLFLQPSNLLVLDEPTNDLDIETLELLESLVAEYPGTVIVISHDRQFLDNVVTSSIVFGKNGRVSEFVGGYSDWVHQTGGNQSTNANKATASNNKQQGTQKSDTKHTAGTQSKAKPVKLSYKLQRELDAMPDKINALEEEIEQLQATMSEPGFYGSGKDTEAVTTRAAEAAIELEQSFERWEQLEQQRDGAAT